MKPKYSRKQKSLSEFLIDGVELDEGTDTMQSIS